MSRTVHAEPRSTGRCCVQYVNPTNSPPNVAHALSSTARSVSLRAKSLAARHTRNAMATATATSAASTNGMGSVFTQRGLA